jgi:hypothetical protein
MVKFMKERWKRVLINAFIVFHLYIMAIWGLPGSTFRYYFTKPIADYVIWSGLWHSWDMFSPDPLTINFTLQAEITYQNGASKVWTFPRMEKLGYWERYQKERYRKWRERVRIDIYSAIWDDTARYIARLNDTPTNHPVQVTLIRYWEPIPVPAMVPRRSTFRDYQPMIEEPKYPFKYHFKVYDVKPGDL